MKKFRLATLGCRTNQYESQAFRDQLLKLGFVEAHETESADLCIVNTCTVTAKADSDSRSEIRDLARKNPLSTLIVTGCLAERDPESLLSIEGVSAAVSNKNKENLLQDLFPDLDVPEFAITHFESRTRAFVKVQDGCNSFCTYCIIPYVRGRSRSRPIADIVKEVEALVASGYKEVVLTGINIGDFDGGLAPLVAAIDRVEGLKRLRISSIDPDEVDHSLQEAVLNGKTTCKSLHLVLQSGSNVTLKRMNRKYTRQIFLETVERLQKADPDFTFTTDVIIGFPGETEADFEETLDVMRHVQFAKVHVFPFSPRERTRAFLYPNRIAPDVIKERKARALHVWEQSAFDLRNRFVHREMTILTEHQEKTGGHTDNFLMVHLQNSPQIAPNQLVECNIIENTPDGLIGARIP